MLYMKTSDIKEKLEGTVRKHLENCYPAEQVNYILKGLTEQIASFQFSSSNADKGFAEANKKIKENSSKWDETTSMLITYGDSLKDKEGRQSPLSVLTDFASFTKDFMSVVHILPFYSETSDGGFAVQDYEAVNERMGTWEDVHGLTGEVEVMFDFVLNHISSYHKWFVQFIKGELPGKNYIRTADPEEDLSQVIRPRRTPLLRPVETVDGMKHVWCTFGLDQVDVDFSNPDLYLEFTNILLKFIAHGARFVRLDAVGFLWKKIGTGCMHLPETHSIVKSFRSISEIISPSVVTIAELNVPQDENLTYFGDEDESDVIYNFSLPPLLVHMLLSGNSKYFTTWLKTVPQATLKATYLNITSTHDGIGMRPLEGQLPDEEVELLSESLQSFGAKIGYRTTQDGGKSMYEACITYYDSLKGTIKGVDGNQIDRFLCSQAIAASLQGIPATYILCLLATHNDYENMKLMGKSRSVNRSKLFIQSVQEELQDDNSERAIVFSRIKELFLNRKLNKAFHPSAPQRVCDVPNTLVAVERTSLCSNHKVLCVANVTDKPNEIKLSDITDVPSNGVDLITGDKLSADSAIQIKPYQVIWYTQG